MVWSRYSLFVPGMVRITAKPCHHEPAVNPLNALLSITSIQHLKETCWCIGRVVFDTHEFISVSIYLNYTLNYCMVRYFYIATFPTMYNGKK